uniref:Ubiquitin-like protease family profile domain-containing protein n=1 Tax=Brassica campestris TaxID=3711 RepID=A0A3P5Z2W9_BRACM|nr:unnamed protein product [Brassica rapa]
MMKINPNLRRLSRKHLPKMPNQSPKRSSNQGRHQRKKTRSASRDASDIKRQNTGAPDCNFRSSLQASKGKGKTAFAHKGCQTEPTNDNVPVSSHDVCQTGPQADISHHTGSDSLPDSVGHRPTINAFSATATSKPSSAAKTKHSSAQQAQPTEDSDVVSLSDSDGSPAPKRPKHIPSIEENHLAKQLERCKTVPAPDLLSPLPQIEWDLFEKIISKSSAAFHITPSKLDFSNNFLLQLAHPMKWTTTYHMEILMHMLAARYSLLFEEQKLAFITPHLTSGIQAISKAFNKSRKRDTFEWDEQLTGLVLQPGKKWMEDVLTVYTPMIWGDKHWVGLAINLDLGCVEVLDPLPTLYKDSAVGRFMAPVLKVLPYLVKKVANYELTQFRGLAPFTCHRIKDLYINERGGDSWTCFCQVFWKCRHKGIPITCQASQTGR